ncbi:MAG: hypothetical protein K0U78_15060 [Actinomycetia bacterium]|nr:hypothetical protein [Actinomycetes bacterium]
MIDDNLQSLLENQGYIEVKEINGNVIGLLPFAFSFGIVIGLTEIGYEYRYCYPKYIDAIKDWKEWDGKGHPSGNWIKLKGIGRDVLNPDYEQ